MSQTPLKIIVGTNNRHKFREINQIFHGLPNIDLVGLSAFTGLPEVVEDGSTFEANAEKKALEIAKLIALYGRVGYASQSTAMDDGETDFQAISAKRHAAASGRQKPVSVTPNSSPKIKVPKRLDLLVLADDSGLEVDALNGAPGVRSARYAGRHGDDKGNNALLLSNMKGVPPEKRQARFVCAMSVASPEGVLFTVRGTVEGSIQYSESGSGGFGYDPLFYYPPENKSFGELDAENKNTISHRHNALVKIRAELEKLLASRG
ncbi:non-canonical purine NTP pyrophosphatase [Planctomycetota bacterium]|nr:non-canonical purine NTP pyrophosphatase [Planctomycetota bacterium]